MLGVLLLLAGGPGPVALSPGLVLSSSTVLKPGVYRIASGGDSKPAIVIRGNNLTLDFRSVVLEGSPTTVDPDKRAGLGILIEGRNVTIKNLRVRGYKVGLMARNSPGLKLLDADLSYNWKPRLLSTQEREDLADWMSYHQNEKDEWLRYGAGAYLRGCPDFEVRGLRVNGGGNALMLTECDKGLVWNSDLSFNSSLGIGMYRSSDNRIMHNKIDWCVRGFSYGVYNRGQDSAGILVYEQSHRNVFAYNSVTHGGDGFFLWAGQTTMDTGKGGCNDNVLIRNDFSHAPTNGIEATFSRNTFADNLLLECWHGVWGGYSYDTKVVANHFGFNGQAIAWEHGQDSLIAGNRFVRDGQGVVLWANPSQDPNWGYPKNRDTRSRDMAILGNQFDNIALGAIRLRATLGARVESNEFAKVNRAVLIEDGQPLPILKRNVFEVSEGALFGPDKKSLDLPATNELKLSAANASKPTAMNPSGGVDRTLDPSPAAYAARFRPLVEGWQNAAGYAPTILLDHGIKTPSPLAGGMDPFLSLDAKRGWRYILVDDWGPYDFKRPLLWPRGTQGKDLVFEVLGPKGRWQLAGIKGGTWKSARAGTTGHLVRVAAGTGSLRIGLVYRGQATTDVRGIQTRAGAPVAFGYSKFVAPIDWAVKFYPWTLAESADVHAAPEPAALAALWKGQAAHEMKTDRLDFGSSGSFYPGGPNDRFSTVATGTLTIPKGEYVLEVTTDDGIRVFVDDKPVLASWKYQGPTPYSAKVRLGGTHRIRVEHFEIDGYSALKLNLRPQ